jgi:hypothetical protein
MSRNRQFGYSSKELNEHLTPLRRFLEHSVGKRWNDVWSEICKIVPADTAVLKHVRDHVKQYVFLDASFDKNGNVFDCRYPTLDILYKFYVDKNGLLAKGQISSFKSEYKQLQQENLKHLEKTVKIIHDKIFCHVDNVWFEIIEHYLCDANNYSGYFSKKKSLVDNDIIAVLSKSLRLHGLLKYSQIIIGIKKKQAFKKQIKTYSLNEQ